jgi:hypothetical protein
LKAHADGTVTVIPYFSISMFTVEEQGLMSLQKLNAHVYSCVMRNEVEQKKVGY